MSDQNRPKPKPKPHRGGPESRADAMQLLAEGFQLATVARQLGVRRATVRDWRDSPEGQRLLAAARKERAAGFAEAIEDARRILREAAPRAAQVLADKLASVVPFEAAGAAQQILNRVGLPAVTKVDATVAPTLDLARLSDEEVAQLEALATKARPAGA